MFSKISDGVGILTIIDDSKFMEWIGKAFTATNVAIDVGKSIYKLIKQDYNKYELLNLAADVIIDFLGFVGPLSTLASLQLKYGKKGIPFVAEQLARLNIELENYFVDMCIRFSLLGVK